jgi:hypothetical protein
LQAAVLMFYCRSDEAELQVCEVDFRGCANYTCRTAAAHGRSLENEGGSQHLVLQYQKAKKKEKHTQQHKAK